MSYKIKLRITLKSGKVQKVAFNMDEGKTIRLHGEMPGLAILSLLTGDPQKAVCQLTLEGGALKISGPSA
jgi:hypothetical protein